MPSASPAVPSGVAPGLRLRDLVAALGGGLATSVPSDAPDPLIDDITLAEPCAGVTGVPGDLLLGLGVTTALEALALLEVAATAGVSAVALRRALSHDPAVGAAAAAAGLPLVSIADEASWAHITWLLRELLDRAFAGAPTRDGLGPDELFALADACAALVGGPVTIEDTSSRVLAYSESTAEVDPARVSTIVGRRVPAATVAALRARGVFRHLVRSAEPLFLPPASDGSLGARLIVPVRAGDEWIGSIWALVDAPVPESVQRSLREVAAVVALQLLRLRTAADLGRRLVGEKLQAALAGDTRAAAEIALPPPPWRVVILGSDPTASPTARLAHWESVVRRAAWQRPHLVLADDDVVAVVADRATDAAPSTAGIGAAGMRAPAPERQTWEWLGGLVGEVARRRDWAWAGASAPVRSVAELEAALGVAREVARLRATGALTGAVVDAESAWAPLLVARAVGALGGGHGIPDPARPEPFGLASLDPVLAQTLRVWLDHPGDLRSCAATLGVHVNTVRYRLARVRAELGLDLGDPTARLALALALRATEPS
jgi:hypothetical protein